MSYANLDNVPTQIAGTSELLASDWNVYVRDNFDALKYGHLVFADSSARNAGIGSPVAGIMVFLSNESGSEVLQVYGGSGWRAAVNTPSIVDLAVTTGKIAALAVTTAKIDDNAVTQVKMADDSVGTAEIVDANVTYAKLNANAKTYDVPTSGTGVYFTASGDFTSDSLSTASAQNPLVIANAAVPITLSLPNTIGTAGATITIANTGIDLVTISPKSGAEATINGSTTNTYTLADPYSILTLVCLSNSGANGTWIIEGEYA